MAKTSDSIEIELSPEDTWAAVSDLSRFPEWLVLHDDWRSDVPAADELGEGTEVSSIVTAKGTRVRFNWVVDVYEPITRVRLSGHGKGGVKVKLDLTVAPSGSGSVVTFTIDLGGVAMFGPAGKAAAKVVSGDLQKSLANFRDVFC